MEGGLGGRFLGCFNHEEKSLRVRRRKKIRERKVFRHLSNGRPSSSLYRKRPSALESHDSVDLRRNPLLSTVNFFKRNDREANPRKGGTEKLAGSASVV
ncbi:hypothetical protein NL676_022878 [Syzygium grande]|nr:hypothetical protein NL676_022878 [Syzygium grande]